MRFPRGRTVVRRCLHPDGRIAAVQSGVVVADDDPGLLVWVDAGAATMRRTTLTGEPTRPLAVRDELALPTMLRPATWGPHRTLRLIPPHGGASIAWCWRTDGTFDGWYVNLESPPRRWPGGVDVHDQALDLIVDPDRAVTWKDEDAFAAQTGEFWTAADAVRIRAAADRLAGLAARAAFPFDGTWCDFRPDPGWAPAELPAWWDVP
jgi:hypothetical protein